MQVTSISYIIFLISSCFLYFIIPKVIKKPFLLVASLFFYGQLQPAFLPLLFISTFLSWLCGLGIALNFWKKRKLWLFLGTTFLFGALLIYKYLDFFCNTILRVIGTDNTFKSGLLLPIGISFYTFSITGYLFDVYNRKIDAERNFIDYALFVSFFPSVLSGPINRARDFLPQLKQETHFSISFFKQGLYRIAIGAVKKVVLADTLGLLVDAAYSSPYKVTGKLWILVSISYSLQIYLDFSGYSDIAIGAAKILGFSIHENFRHPYLATSVKDFWKRWHISLTDWFREYIYFPLGGSRKGKIRTYINVLIVFTVSGLWHGAGLHFIAWGLINGIYQVIEGLLTPIINAYLKRATSKLAKNIITFISILFSFFLITLSWIFFRAGSLTQALYILQSILAAPWTASLNKVTLFAYLNQRQVLLILFGIILVLINSIFSETGKSLYNSIEKHPLYYWLSVCFFCIVIAVFGVYGQAFDAQSFVYFKF